MDEWAKAPDLFDHSTPIGKKLKLISNLFRQEWLNPSSEFGIDQSIKFDAYKLQRFFEHGMKDYCRLIMNIDCDKGKLKGNYIEA